MSVTELIGRSFGAADYGVAWAMFQLPGGAVRGGKFCAGDVPVVVGPLAGAAGPDDYAARPGRSEHHVLANTPVGTAAGLLRLGELLRAGQTAPVAGKLRFRTRNYKHELHLAGDSPRCVTRYTDDLWEGLCQNLLRHQFNGLVLYAGMHPFEYLLDYNDFPEAATRPAAQRVAIRAAVSRGLEIAHRYGLRTFLHHYVGHFTPAFRDHHHLPTAGRLAGIDHPEVERYCRWCYREVFQQVPNLDGLYFNFESWPNAAAHVLNTAVAEFNRRREGRPIFVFRLWSFNDAAAMRELVAAYKGPALVSHKIADTSDVYYLPVADSRIAEWKKKLGKRTELLVEVGPCHNCATNLCNSLWGDYGFVQELLADAAKKGADSISFHTVNEFFSPDVPDTGGVFGEHEKALARFNWPHLQAAVDFVNRRALPAKERAAALARRVGVAEQRGMGVPPMSGTAVPAVSSTGVSPVTGGKEKEHGRDAHATHGQDARATEQAGKALLAAVEAASQPVLLAFQQFAEGSEHEGYINPGRHSHIQDPFMDPPATELNDQAKRLAWRPRRIWAWLPKAVDTKVAPDNFVQYIIDFVNPAARKAVRNPRKLADLLEEHVEAARTALASYAKAAGAPAAAALEPFLAENALLARFVRLEILAAIELYAVYFAKTPAAVTAGLRRGLEQLQAAQALVADGDSHAVRTLLRALMLDRLDLTGLIRATAEAVEFARRGPWPFKPWRDYLDSRRQYNEIRRVVRPLRWHDAKTMAHATKCLKAAIAKAKKALAGLKGKAGEPHADHVRAWLEFVENELARTTPPKAAVPREESGPFLPLQHDSCFRFGENFVEDFTGFFRRHNYLRSAGMSFRLWHTADALAVQFRERGVNMAYRREGWGRCRDGSDAFVQRIYLDTAGEGAARDCYIVWPEGRAVSQDGHGTVDARVEFSFDDSSWQTVTYLPYALIGRKPQRRKPWGFNITSNPALLRYYCYTWAPQYDGDGNPHLFGKIRFA